MADFPNKADGPAPLPAGKRPKPTPVISGAKKANRSVMDRLRAAIFTESPKTLMGRIAKDTIGPRVKLGIHEVITSFSAGMLGVPNQYVSGRGMQPTLSQRMNYSGASTAAAAQQAQGAVIHRNSGNYQDIVCPDEHGEFGASTLLAKAIDYISQYNMMSIGDLYEMATLPSLPSDESYGWHSIDGARIYQTAEGFELKMPRPTLL